MSMRTFRTDVVPGSIGPAGTAIFMTMLCSLLLCCSGHQSDGEELLNSLQNDAESMVRRREWGQALVQYNRAVKLAPDSPDLYYQIGCLHRLLGNIDQAIVHLEKAVNLNPRHSEALLELGYCYLFTKRYDDAEATARVMLKADPNNVQARLLMGDREALTGSYERALARLHRLTMLNPRDPLVFMRLGDLNLVLGKRVQAQEAYMRALALAPELPQTWISWANFRAVEGDIAGQEEALRKIVSLDPENLTHRLNLGDFCLEQGRCKDGQEVYEKALDEISGARKNYRLLARVAEVFLFSGEREKAESLILQLERLQPKGSEIAFFRGHLALADGRIGDAAAAFQQALYYGGPSDTLYFYLGLAQWLNGYMRQARASWQEALRLNPAFVRALLHLAALSMVTGDELGANDALGRVLELLPINEEAHFLLALNLLAGANSEAFERERRLLYGMGMASDRRMALLSALGGDADLEGTAAAEYTRSPADLKRLQAIRCDDIRRVDGAMRVALALDENGSWLRVHGSELKVEDSERQNSLDWWYVKARYGLLNKDIQGAREAIHRLQHVSRSDPAVLRLAISLAEREGDTEAQVAAYRTFISTIPDEPQALNNLAWLLAERNDPEALKEARTLAEKACEKRRGDAALQDTRGWVYYRLGMNESARQAWELAASLAPDDTRIREHLALLTSP